MAAESSSYERDLMPFSLNEVMSLNDIDLVEKFSLISINSSLRSRVTLQYKCKLLGDSCNNITAGRRAKQDMVRHLRKHLTEICSLALPTRAALTKWCW